MRADLRIMCVAISAGVFGVSLSGCTPSPSSPPHAEPSEPAGSPSTSSTAEFDDTTPRFSPDGRTIVFVRAQGEDSDILVMDVEGGAVRTLVDASDYDLDPAFSPDGRQIVFDTSPNAYPQLHLVSSEGGETEPISEVLDGWATFPAWSPSGDEVVYSCGHPSYEESDLCVLTVTGEFRGFLEPKSESQELEPAWSPDGSAVAFSSDRSGDPDLYVIDLETDQVTRLTRGGSHDGDPAWSPDGQTIAFTRGDAPGVMVCLVRSGGGGVRCVTPGVQPSWSSDGAALVFYRTTDGGDRIFVSEADGTNVTRLT